MRFEELLQLMQKLEDSTIKYLEYDVDGNRVVLSKEVPNGRSQDQEEGQVSKPKVTKASTEQPQVVEEAPTASLSPQGQGHIVKSPIVGVVYLQAKPDADPFVSVGTKVEKGQTICIIEAMKLMNDIVAPVSGTIQAIHVTNEMVVEYDQALFEIIPN